MTRRCFLGRDWVNAGTVIDGISAEDDDATGKNGSEYAHARYSHLCNLSLLRYRIVPVIPIIGARNFSQFQENLASFDLALSEDQLKTLDEASQKLQWPGTELAKTAGRMQQEGTMGAGPIDGGE